MHYADTRPLRRMQGDLITSLRADDQFVFFEVAHCRQKWTFNDLSGFFFLSSWSAHKPGYDRAKIICCCKRKDSDACIRRSRILQPCFRHQQYSCLGSSIKSGWLESHPREIFICKVWFIWLILALSIQMI